ncbi:hypothetical protein [Streptomyces sp. NPDC088261]|uniref:hypothetical protein n=1 Tax=Streptomyces sp. NPDC088261 TaxID=3365851 RepID=UPI003829B0AF
MIASGATFTSSAFATAAAIAGILGLASPQAVAVERTPAAVTFAAGASAETRAIVAVNPKEAAAAAVECGAGYELNFAERLPDASRSGTLFSYTKLTGSRWDACAVFENNTTSAKYMKLKICPSTIGGTCAQDEGTFSSYAGPVHLTNAMCGNITALMKSSSSSSSYIINAVRGATPCN